MVLFGFGSLWSINLLRRLWQGKDSRVDEYLLLPSWPSPPSLALLHCAHTGHAWKESKHLLRWHVTREDALGWICTIQWIAGNCSSLTKPGMIPSGLVSTMTAGVLCMYQKIPGGGVGGRERYSHKFTMRFTWWFSETLEHAGTVPDKNRWILQPGCRQ